MIASVVFLVSCTDQVATLNYPVITLTTITDISDAGMTLDVKFNNDQAQNIIDHGFIWTVTGGAGIDSEASRTLTASYGPLGSTSSGSFTEDIRALLFNKREYNIRAFIKTDTYTVNGLGLPFTSKGSAGLVIDDITPKSVKTGDLVTITGHQFGTLIKMIRINVITPFSGPASAVVQSVHDTAIVFKMPVIPSNNQTTIEITHVDTGTKTSPIVLVVSN